jgi:hypothetical protein
VEIVSLEALGQEEQVEAPDRAGTFHNRLESVQRGRATIPWLLATARNYRAESAAIRFDLGRLPKAVCRQR